MKVTVESPLLGNLKSKKAPAKARGMSPPMMEAYQPPSPDEMKQQAAHSAHRDVVSQWVRGEASDAKMQRSHTRLNKIVKAGKSKAR